MRIISKKEVENSLTMRGAIEIVREAFIELSTGTAIIPPRIHLSVEKRNSTTLVMPAFLGGTDALACKIVSVFPNNSALHLPIIHGLVVLIEAESGKPLALIEGASLTALRTGAASGLATNLLAQKDAKTLAIIGAGTQSKAQIEAVCLVREIEKIWIYDRLLESAQKFVRDIQTKINSEIIVAESAKQAVAQADIICTATTSKQPVFDGNFLRNGTHVNGIGSFTSQMQEVDFKTLQRASKIVVDSRENCLKEAGELVQAIEQKVINETDIYAEIGEIAAGFKIGRENEREITFFKSVGNAVQDVAIAKAIYQISIEQNLGVVVDW